MEINEITGQIIDSAMKVHTVLGPGLLESAYEACLAHELRKRGFTVEVQRGLPIEYDGVLLDVGYRIDLLVEDTVIVEVKAVNEVHPIHHAQLLSYSEAQQKEDRLANQLLCRAIERRHQAHGLLSYLLQ